MNRSSKMRAMKKRCGRAFCTLVLCVCAVTALVPLVFTLTGSFIGNGELSDAYSGLLTGGGSVRFILLPKTVTLDHYTSTLLLTPSYLIKFWVSLGLTAAIVLGQITVSCLAGYGFAKFRFPGRNLFLYTIIVLMLMPVQVMLVPQYLVLDKIGLLGSYWSLILVGWFGAFGIFLMTQIYRRFPDDILEAAEVDGAGALRRLWSIVLPNSVSGISSLLILSFIDNWNLVEQPLVFLKDYRKYPLSVFLSYINNESLGAAFVCGVLAMLPALLLFLFLKEEMIRGIEYASVK